MTVNNKEKRFKRETAERHLDILMEKVRAYNANPFNPYMFSDIVVFGSYVNDPQKQMLGDLDIGFKLEPRYFTEESFAACMEIGEENALGELPSLTRLPSYVDWTDICQEYALKFIKHGLGYIALHRIADEPGEGENPYIFDKAIKRMDTGMVARFPDDEIIAYADEAFGEYL